MNKIEKCRQCRFWRSAEDAYNMYGDSDLCLVDSEPRCRHGDFPICLYIAAQRMLADGADKKAVIDFVSSIAMEEEQSDEGIEVVLPDFTTEVQV